LHSERIVMSIEELIIKVQEAEKKRTPQQRLELLIKAHILDKDGHYDARYFRKETVEKSKLQTVAS